MTITRALDLSFFVGERELLYICHPDPCAFLRKQEHGEGSCPSEAGPPLAEDSSLASGMTMKYAHRNDICYEKRANPTSPTNNSSSWRAA